MLLSRGSGAELLSGGGSVVEQGKWENGRVAGWHWAWLLIGGAQLLRSPGLQHRSLGQCPLGSPPLLWG